MTTVPIFIALYLSLFICNFWEFVFIIFCSYIIYCPSENLGHKKNHIYMGKKRVNIPNVFNEDIYLL